MVVTTWNSLLFFGMNGAIMLTWIALLFFLVKVLLLIPVEFLRWVIIALAGGASSWFIALNLKECTQGADLMVLMASASVLQFALALFIKVFFFAWGCLLILQRSASLFLTPQYPPSLPLLNWGFGTEKKNLCFWQVTWCALCPRLVLENIFRKGRGRQTCFTRQLDIHIDPRLLCLGHSSFEVANLQVLL